MSMAPELDEEIAALSECLRERTEERDRLRAALKPFAFLGSILTGKEKDTNIFVGQVSPDGVHHPVTFGDLRHAAELIYE